MKILIKNKFFFLPSLILGFLVFNPLFSQVLWYGDPDKGREVFNNLNFEGAERYSPGSGTILPATDPVYGKIWRIYKPAPDKRAEIRGATGFSNHVGKGGVIKEGETYYLGWRYKFDMPDEETGDWTCFQWKCYPDPDNPDNPLNQNQNFPILMSYNGRNLTLTKFGTGWQDERSRIVRIWSRPVQIGHWVDVVLVIKLSRDVDAGYIELYFNGEKQELLGGGTRVYHNTMGGWEIAPKWGAYNKNAIGTEITVDIADMRIGSDLESVFPEPAPAGIPHDIMIHTFDSALVERYDFHRYKNWYEEEGNTQTFKLHPGDCNTRNSRKYCRIEAHTKLGIKRGEMHEFTATYKVNSAEEVAIFQVFNATVVHPQLMVVYMPNGDIRWQSRDNPNGYLAYGYRNQEFTLHVKDDGIKWQLFFNGEKAAEGIHQEKGPDTICEFRWGLYNNKIPSTEIKSTVKNISIKRISNDEAN